MRIIIPAEEDGGEKGLLTLTDDALDNANYVEIIFKLIAKSEEGTSGSISMTVPVDELYRAVESFKGLQEDRK